MEQRQPAFQAVKPAVHVLVYLLDEGKRLFDVTRQVDTLNVRRILWKALLHDGLNGRMDEFGAPFFSGVAVLLESVAAIIVARVVIARGVAAAIRVSAFCLRVQVKHGTHLVSFLSINALVHFPARAVFVLLL